MYIEPPKIKFNGKEIPLGCCVFMKVGSHGDEAFQQIIERKHKEEQLVGFNLWGYSGTLMNPKTTRHFLSSNWKQEQRVFLLMPETKSPFKNSPVVSKAFSLDGQVWYSLPNGIGTRGCTKALVCRDLQHVSFDININRYIVAVGPSAGRPLSLYLKHRTDKACAIYSKTPINHDCANTIIHIDWIAELIPPFAIYLRDTSSIQTPLFRDSDNLGALQNHL